MVALLGIDGVHRGEFAATRLLIAAPRGISATFEVLAVHVILHGAINVCPSATIILYLIVRYPGMV